LGFTIDMKADIAEVFAAAKATGGTPLSDEAKAILVPAPNAIEWSVRRDYLNQAVLYQFPRSYQVIRDFFELRCPLCNDMEATADCWGKSRDALASEVLLIWNDVQKDDVCPRCGCMRSELMEDGLLNGYNQLHGLAGQRSGKSVTCAYIATFMEHKLLCEGHTHPQGLAGYFDMFQAAHFEGSFLAASEVQSKDTVWASFRNLRSLSPWFKRYTDWVKEEAKQQQRSAMQPWDYEETHTFIRNKHPKINMIINSLHSNSGTMAGRTRVFSVLDEMARMNATDSSVGAQEIYSVHENSLQSVRSSALLGGCAPWVGAMLSITSTTSRNDLAWNMWKRAKAGNIRRMVTFKYATWEFNPRLPFWMFTDDMIKNPVMVMRDFGAEPPGAMHPLIANEPRFRALAIARDLRPRAQFVTSRFRGPQGHEYIRADMVNGELMAEHMHYLVFDAGLNFDAFAGVCAHGEPIGEGRVATVYDWVFRIVPPKGSEVYFDCVLDIVEAATRRMHIAAVEFDQWNSRHLIQQLCNKHGVNASQRSLVSEDFRMFANDSVSGVIRLLPPAVGDVGPSDTILDWLKEEDQLAPESVVIKELTSLQCDPDTLSVYNPQKGRRRGFNSDDLARVVVHANKLVQSQGYTKRQGSHLREDARKLAYEYGPKLDPFIAGSNGAPMNATPGGSNTGGSFNSIASFGGAGRGTRGGSRGW